jgi:transposase
MTTKLIKTNNKQTEKLDFTGQNVYVGIDVHKASWACCVYLEDSFFKQFTQPPGADALKAFLISNFPGGNYYSCYEAGFTGFTIHRDLTAVGINCIVVNPADVPLTNKAALTKTDTIDAKRLAINLSKGQLSPINIPSKVEEADRKLVRYRKLVQKNMANYKRGIRSLLFTLGIKIPQDIDKTYWSNKFIKWLQELDIEEQGAKSAMTLLIGDFVYQRKRLYEVTKQIRLLSESDKYKSLMTLLRSVPGIGLIIGMTIITEIMNIERFKTFNQFNGYVGIYPNQFSSGENVRMGKMTPRHNNYLRPLLIEAAWIAIRHDSALMAKFNEVVKRKTKNRAIVVIARKLLSRIYTVWSTGAVYQTGLK